MQAPLRLPFRLTKALFKRHRRLRSNPSAELVGTITEFYPEQGFGFIESRNGRRTYFSRDSIMSGDLENMNKGVRVMFIEETGTVFPHASAVRVL